jgi:ribonuclease HI
MLWRHFPKATSNTMEMRAVAEALSFLAPNMVVWVSSDLIHYMKGFTQWIHNGKRSGRKKSKKKRVANATLWRELDTAIAYQSRVAFTWAKAQSGILLNECGDQLAMHALSGRSYGPELAVPPNEPESDQEFVLEDDDVTQWEDWGDHEHPPRKGTPAISVGFAAEEQREQQEESLQRFRPSCCASGVTPRLLRPADPARFHTTPTGR